MFFFLNILHLLKTLTKIYFELTFTFVFWNFRILKKEPLNRELLIKVDKLVSILFIVVKKNKFVR